MYFNNFVEMEEPVKDKSDGPIVTNDYVIAYGHSKFSNNFVFGIGDMPAGTSNVINKSALKNKQKQGDRLKSKPSQIPRYRYNQKEPPILESSAKSIVEHSTKLEKPRRKLLMKSSLEKVNLHNRKRDIRSEIQSETSSAIITKVLLEEIRGRNKIGSDRLNEWLMESATDYLRPIANCFGTSNISSTMVPQTSQSECDVNARMTLDKMIEALSNQDHNAIIELDKNVPYIAFEDLGLDLRPELDLSNKDHVIDNFNEHNKPNNTEITTNAMFENCVLKTKEYFKSKSPRRKIEKETEKDVEQKIEDSRIEDNDTKINEAKKNAQYNVTSAGDHLTETEKNNLSGSVYDINENVPTSSYIDCPSEILQRMTNLEAEGYDLVSSVSGTDIEIRDDFLSNYNFEQAYSSLMEGRSENWILDNCNDSLCCIEEPRPEEPRPCKSHTDNQKRKKDTSDSHDYHHHYCWRREVTKRCSEKCLRDCRGQCKKCQRTRTRTKTNQIRIPKPFITFTKHLSVGRICRRRWNLMWKGTAERWASKPKSPSKFRTFATMLDLQRSGFWENADVQTTVLLYHEAGTDAVAKEQKSAGIEASQKLYTEAYTKIESDTSIDKNQAGKQHTQVGPSTLLYAKHKGNILTGNSAEPSRYFTNPFASYNSIPIKLYKNEMSSNVDQNVEYKKPVPTVNYKEKESVKVETDETNELIYSHANKWNNKTTEFTNLAHFKSQIDRGTDTDGSLLLISKKKSSASTTSELAMIVNSNAQEAFNQTDDLRSADTETNINCNNSMEIYCDDSSLCSYDVDFYKPHVMNTDSLEYGYAQSQHTLRMVKSKTSRKRLSSSGLVVASHHNIGVTTSNDMLSPISTMDVNTSRNLVYVSDKSGDTLMSSDRSADYAKLIMSSSVETEEQEEDKDASTETITQFNDLTKETSRYLCSRQYDTNAHGTLTGSSFYIEAFDKDTNTNICDIYIDTAVSSPNLIQTCNFNGGPISHFMHKAVSTQGLVKRYSFSGGSHRSQRSFTADIHPEYATNCTSMTDHSVKKSPGVKCPIHDNPKQSGFADKSHVTTLHDDSSESISKGFLTVAPTPKRGVAIQVVLDNTDVKSRKVLSTSVGIFTSVHGLSQSNQTLISKLDVDKGTSVKLVPATSKGTYTSCHNAGASVQTGFKTLKKTVGTQLSSTPPPDADCHALKSILMPMKVKNNSKNKKSTNAIQIQTFVQCQTVTKAPKSTSSEDMEECENSKTKSVKYPNTLSTMIDKITTTDQELKCIRQEINSNVRNIGINVNLKSRNNKIAKEINKKISLPVKKQKWNRGKAKEFFLVYDAQEFVPHKFYTELFAQVPPSKRNSHKRQPTLVQYVNVGTQIAAKDWKIFNENRSLSKAMKHRAPSSDCRRNHQRKSKLFYLEACTMKPSSYQNASCQTYEYIIPVITIASASTCILSPALSLTDICEGKDKNDLQAVYYMLTAIEGRIRRLKRNIRCR